MNESDTSLANNTGHFNLLTTAFLRETIRQRFQRRANAADKPPFRWNVILVSELSP